MRRRRVGKAAGRSERRRWHRVQRIQNGARPWEWIGFRQGIREAAQGHGLVFQLWREGDEDASAAAVFLEAWLGKASLGFERGAGGDGCHLGPLGFLVGGAAGGEHGGDQLAANSIRSSDQIQRQNRKFTGVICSFEMLGIGEWEGV